MNGKTKFLIVALATCMAMPASAQRLGREKPKDALPDDMSRNTETTTTSAATTTTGRKLDISKGAQKAIVEFQTAVTANDVATIPAKLAAARAVAKTNDDKFIIASIQTKAALTANDNAAIQAGIEAMQASGSAENPDLAARFSDLGKRYKAAGQVDQSVAMLNKSLAIDPNNVGALINLAAIKESQGLKAEAVTLMQKSFIASKATGKKVEEGNYKFAAGLAYAQRMPLANDLARQWYAAYPSPASMRDSLRIYRDLNRPTQAQLIDLLRLGRAANALSGETDYFALGSALVNAGKLAEAKSLMVEAKTAPKVDTTKSAFTDVVKKAAAAPARAAIDASAKAALASGNGKAMIDAGDGLYGVGAYAEAVPLYRAALAKGGDPGLANLHLGMALARSGDKAGAIVAFNAVTGANADVARYWLMWLATQA
ncbi:tetratricopeptide repeat protein [Sphingomonas sp.]|uniref:tetratricopeptide repeat protein n=1 Tax=Sphingomonas sp. TaxID=28214 RepID=UPI00286C12EE|nr:tetratricopeptide repeat protein [Sphingomonas sp.]